MMSIRDSLQPSADGRDDLSSRSACLRAVELFSEIPAAELAALNEMLPLTTFGAGQVVYDPCNPVQALFIVKSGRVRVFQLSPQGKSFTLAVYSAGDVFGNMPVLGQSLGNSYVETLEVSSLCQLTTQQVNDHFLADPRVSSQVAKILSQRVAELEMRLSDLALRPLNQRVASLLLSTATDSLLPWKHNKNVKLTHEQLAHLVGATREAVSKAVAELAAHGFIEQHRGFITIINYVGLNAYKDQISE